MPTERRLQDFAGSWRLDREIRHDDGAEGRFVGTADFTPDAQGLVYVEKGVLTLEGGAAMRAERRYLWRDGLEVLFGDGRPFHVVPPTGGTAGHFCPPDQYDVTYDFSHWPEWMADWAVQGPRKAYRMSSIYRR